MSERRTSELYASWWGTRYVLEMKPSNVCPTCKGNRKPQADNPTFPFCSARCKLADLGNWLSGRYSLDAEPAPVDGEDDRRRLN